MKKKEQSIEEEIKNIMQDYSRRKIRRKITPRLLERKDRYCGKCLFTTPHVYVRNIDVEYWRCENCVEMTVNSVKIFIPKYVEKRHFWEGFNDLEYKDQMNKFKKRG